MGRRRVAVGISALLVVASLAVIGIRGINYGIDFLGGLKLTYLFSGAEAPVTDGAIVDVLAKSGIVAQVQQFGSDSNAQRFLIKVALPAHGEDAAVAQITTVLAEHFGSATREGVETVGPRVGRELRVRGQKTVIFILVAMLLYIGFRFDFLFAPGAVVALAHDVLITLGVLVLCGVEFNLTILAALLTIAGYSVNDTIVIYDRIREHGRDITLGTLSAVINRSLTETLSRTLVTGVSTMLAVTILFFVASGDIHDFALAFLVGIVVGTYSSLFIASPVYLALYRRWPPK